MIISAVQSTDHYPSPDRPDIGSLDRATIECVLAKAEMCSRSWVVHEVPLQDLARMPFTQRDHVIETLPLERPHDTFAVSVPTRELRADYELL